MYLPQRTANKQIFWSYLAVRGRSHASQRPFQLDLVDEALATQDDLVCCHSGCMRASTPDLRRPDLERLSNLCM